MEDGYWQWVSQPKPLEPMSGDLAVAMKEARERAERGEYIGTFIQSCGRPHYHLCDACHKNNDRCARAELGAN